MDKERENHPSPAAAPLLVECHVSISHPGAILLIILFTLPLLGIFLGSADPNNMMELFNLVPTREAFRDGHWFMPTLNGAPRFEKPPLAAWIPAAFATLAGSDNLWIVRLPSLLLGIVTALATYAIGCRLFRHPEEPAAHSRRYALFAALLLPAMHLFNQEARIASYDIYAAAFTTLCALCILGLVDAAAPTASPAPRRAARWWLWTLLAGIALGLALLSKGPAPPATVLLPMTLWLLLFHRSRAVLGSLALILLISLFVALPWVIAIFLTYPEARDTWTREIVKLTTGRRAATAAVDPALRNPWYYYLQIFLWVAPLTPTFIAGLALPFLPALGQISPSTRERQGRWLLWMILVGGLLILSFPSEKKMRYALQLAPFACLLSASVWQEFLRLDRRKPVETAAGVMLWAQALFFIVPGIGLLAAGIYVAATGAFLKWPAVADTLGKFGLIPALILGGSLALLGILHLRSEYQRRFSFAAATLVITAAVMMLTVQCVVHRGPASHNPTRPAVEAALAQVGNAPIYTLRDARPWIHTLYFANRIMPIDTPQGFADRAAAHRDQPLYLLVITTNTDASPAGSRPANTVQNCLALLQSQTHRTPETLAQWLDEGRKTILFRFPPAESP